MNRMAKELAQLEYCDMIEVRTHVTRQAMHIRLAPLRKLGLRLSVHKLPGGYLVKRHPSPHARLVRALRQPRPAPFTLTVAPPVSILDLL